MPRKIRDLLKDLRSAGFALVPGGKGSHRKYGHPAVKIPAIIAGRDGDQYKVTDKLLQILLCITGRRMPMRKTVIAHGGKSSILLCDDT